MAVNFHFDKDVAYKPVDPGVERKIMAYDDNIMLCHLKFAKGSVGNLHHHPHTQVTYVLKGAFEFTIGEEKHVVRAGDVLYKQPDIVHGCVCVEEGELLDIFTPKRDDFLK